MQSIVISLKTAKNRREHIESQFGQQNINFTFFDALTPDLASRLAKETFATNLESYLSCGELACFMSHVSVWQKMLDEEIPYLAIFEDDVYLGENASEFLNHKHWIKKKWNIIKLEAFSKKVKLGSDSEKLKNQREILQLKGRHVGGAGYILSLEAAHYLLNLIQQIEIKEPLDHILFDPKYHDDVSLYQMRPALCIQSYLHNAKDCFSSSLEYQRIERRDCESNNRTIWEKIQREIKRLYFKILNIFDKKKIKFK